MADGTKKKLNLEKIEQIEVSRSYDRKIKFGDQYEMAGIFSSRKAILKKDSSEKEIAEISSQIYNTCKEEVELEVLMLQNPGKVVRGFAAISALQNQVRKLEKIIVEQDEKIKKLDVPFQ